MEKASTEKEPAEALKKKASYIEVEGDLAKKVIRKRERGRSYSGLPWCCTQSGMSEPAENVLGCHASQRLAHGIIDNGSKHG